MLAVGFEPAQHELNRVFGVSRGNLPRKFHSGCKVCALLTAESCIHQLHQHRSGPVLISGLLVGTNLASRFNMPHGSITRFAASRDGMAFKPINILQTVLSCRYVTHQPAHSASVLAPVYS